MKGWHLVWLSVALAACPVYGSLGEWRQDAAGTTSSGPGTTSSGTGTSGTGTSGTGGGMSCTPGDMESCYDGAPGTEGVGTCKAGTKTCAANGMTWGACMGEVLLEIALTNGATIVTQNVLLEPGTVVRRADLEDHNREQLDAWWDDVKRPVELQRAPGPTSPSNAATSKTRRAKAARRTRRSGR